MANRVENVGTVTTVFEERFEVTTEWCVAINNIDYVRQSLEPFVVELGMDEIIQKMCEARSPIEAQRYLNFYLLIYDLFLFEINDKETCSICRSIFLGKIRF